MSVAPCIDRPHAAQRTSPARTYLPSRRARPAATGAAGVLDPVVDSLPELTIDERRPRRFIGHDPLVGHLPVLATRRPRRRIARIEQLILPPLPADDLVAEVPRVREDGAHGRSTPYASGASVPHRADLARARVSFAFKDRRDRSVADALVEHLEDPLHDRRGLRIASAC